MDKSKKLMIESDQIKEKLEKIDLEGQVAELDQIDLDKVDVNVVEIVSTE